MKNLRDKYKIQEMLENLGIKEVNSGASTGANWLDTKGDIIESYSPIDGKLIAKVKAASTEDYEKVIKTAQEAFKEWRMIPEPKRGEVVRLIGNKLREKKAYLGKLVSLEMGKSYQEGLGEVQEMIDICDYAVGLSRQLHGFTMHSERPDHRMYEQYHPLGIVGIVSAFNFPVAVWSWNAMISLVCGDVNLWKPSSKTPLCAIASQNIITEAFKESPVYVPEGVSNIIVGKKGYHMAHDKRIPLVSATGSTRMGKEVGKTISARLGRPLLELGGNNAIIIAESANLDLALGASMFGAIGTAGQRCTTTRRLIVHESIYDDFKAKLVNAYKQVKIGNPLDEGNHMGPLIDRDAVEIYKKALSEIVKEGGKILTDSGVLEGFESGCYVKPVIAEVKNSYKIVKEETFAPILYIMKYKTLDEAIRMHNDVPQGLSSSIFTNDLKEAEEFLSHAGSDCGIANVNIGTSGAEIGGAFGGEKDTGGGRESGSDAWKAYMRRQTNTINYGSEMPLAQGIKFDIKSE